MDSYTLPSPELQAEMALEYLLQKMTMMIIFIQKNIVYKEIFNDLPTGNTYYLLKLF